MKKIIVLMMVVFIFSFGFSNEISKIDEGNIIRAYTYDGFEYEQDGDYINFKKRIGKYEQRVNVFIHNGKVYSIHLTSSHYHLRPNIDKINSELSSMIQILKSITKSKDLNKLIDSGYKNIKNKPFGIIESKNGIVRTTDLDTEMGLSIESD